ncbi:uncharacterized protein [Hemitrygon akajei]|uniref:uncharacterized protein n=1 Tax=Hemitrygon akajei TaxID=2704970 RepID=UPI003BF9DB6D
MKVVVLSSCLLAVALAAPVWKTRSLNSGSNERYARYFQPFNPPYYPFQPYLRFPYHRYPSFPFFPGVTYPDYRQVPVFHGFERQANPGASNVKVNYVEESAPEEYSMVNGASFSSEVSLEDSSSVEDDYRITFVNVPSELPDDRYPGVPDYMYPGVPDYEGPVTPDEEFPGVPDYEGPFIPGIDTSVNVDFHQQSPKDTASEGSNVEEVTGVLPLSDSLQSFDSRGLTQEDNEMVVGSNEDAGHHEAASEPTEKDTDQGEIWNSQEPVGQQRSNEDSVEEPQSHENVDASLRDMDFTTHDNDEDGDSYEDDDNYDDHYGFVDNNQNHNDGTESEFNEPDSNQKISLDSDETDLNAGGIEFNENNSDDKDSSEDVTSKSTVEDDSVLDENSETNFSF